MDELPQKAIRTFKSDMAESVQQKKTTVSQIVAAEEMKKRQEESIVAIRKESSSKAIRNIFLIILSLVILAAGASGGYYFYLQSPLAITTNPSHVENSTTFPSLIDDIPQKVVTFSKISGLGSELASELGVAGRSLEELIPIIGTSSVKTKASIQTILTYIAPHAPQTFSRSITGNYMIGVYRGESNAVFVILKNNYFQNALSGMFVWEKSMPEDIENFLSGSTNIDTSLFKKDERFVDGLVNNHDVRILNDTDGNPRIVYAFADNETLIITTKTEALGHLLTILDKQAFIRRK